MNKVNKTVIIVAGGTGTRMASDIPKQFLTVGNEVILMKSIRKFYEFSNDIDIIVALPKSQIEYWEELCLHLNFKIKHKVIEGGEHRFYSVKNALTHANKDGIIAIHDGVRPLVSDSTIIDGFKLAKENGNAIPYIDISDSIRYFDEETNKPVDRSKYKIIQTPQVFTAEILHKAYEQAYEESFTDDASVVENAGFPIHLFKGNRENIKITTPFDIIMAQAFLSRH